MNSMLKIWKSLLWKQCRESVFLLVLLAVSLVILGYLCRGQMNPDKDPSKGFISVFFSFYFAFCFGWFISFDFEQKTIPFLFSRPLRKIHYLTSSFTFVMVLLTILYGIVRLGLYCMKNYPLVDTYFIDFAHFLVLSFSGGAVLLFFSSLTPNRTLNICVNIMVCYFVGSFFFMAYINRALLASFSDIQTILNCNPLFLFLLFFVIFSCLSFYILQWRVAHTKRSMYITGALIILLLTTIQEASYLMSRDINMVYRTSEKIKSITDDTTVHPIPNTMNEYIGYPTFETESWDDYFLRIYGERYDQRGHQAIEDPTDYVEIKKLNKDRKPQTIFHQQLQDVLNTKDMAGNLIKNRFIYTAKSVLVNYSYINTDEREYEPYTSAEDKDWHFLLSKINVAEPTSVIKISKINFTYRDPKITKTFIVNGVYPGIFRMKDLRMLKNNVLDFYKTEYKSLCPKKADWNVYCSALNMITQRFFEPWYNKNNSYTENTYYTAGTNFVARGQNFQQWFMLKPDTISIVKVDMSEGDSINMTYYADIPSPVSLQGAFFMDYAVDGQNLYTLHHSTLSDKMVIYDLSNPEKVSVKAVLTLPFYQKSMNWRIQPDNFMYTFHGYGGFNLETFYCRNNILYTRYNRTIYVYDISDFKSIRPIGRIREQDQNSGYGLSVYQIDKNNFYTSMESDNTVQVNHYYQIR